MIWIFVISLGCILVLMLIFGRGTVSELKRMPKLLMWKILYTDMYSENKKDGVTYGTILHSEKYDLQGKPDIIYRHRLTGAVMPVEVKSGQTEEPHRGDLLQVGAYMLIAEDIYGKRPRKAILSYKNTCFVIRNTHSLRRDVLTTAERMRKMLITGEEEPVSTFANCRSCVCDGTVCEYSYNNED